MPTFGLSNIILMKELLKQHFEKITPLSDEVFDYIFAHFSLRKFKKHQYLIQQDHHVEHEYWVVKGLLKAFKIDESGKEHILQFAMEDWWISDYHALQNHIPATLNIDCIEDCEVYVLTHENRMKLCSEIHEMSNFFLKKTGAGYVALQQRILLLLLKNPQERYDRLLKLSPALIRRVPKKLLATYLGVSRESLSRMHK